MRRNKDLAILREMESISASLLVAFQHPAPTRQSIGTDRVDRCPPYGDRALG
jgi:hypothetical protein